MTLEDRTLFLRKRGHCYGCLNGQHLYKTCEEKMKCDQCGGLHPTLLHDEDRRKPKNVTAMTTNKDNTEYSSCHFNSMIIPVNLGHVDNPKKEIMVYALLDNQSNCSFISQRTLKSLNTSGQPTSIKLSTVHAESIIDTEVVHGLQVSNINKKITLPLPVTYSRQSIPADRELIPRPETAYEWRHLSGIADQHGYMTSDRPELPSSNQTSASGP